VRALVGVLGLVLGILIGACLVLANPLAWFNGLPPLPAELAPVKAYRSDDYRGIEAGVAALLGVGRRDRKVALMDPALPHVRIGIVVLPAGEGMPAALAVKVSAIAEENSLWRAQLGTHDYWNIFWPGEGSVFASGYSNFWGVTRDAFLAVARGGDQELIATARPVSAPSPLGVWTGVTGAAGRYAGFTGEIRELLYPAPPDSTKKGPDWGIALKANPPPVTTR
jgi:hypothetical protein